LLLLLPPRLKLTQATSRGLLVRWAIGLGTLALVTWGSPRWLRSAWDLVVPGMAAERERQTALRQDSIRAVQRADSVRVARGDSVAAVVFVAPDPFHLEQRAKSEERPVKVGLMVAIPLLLVWHTYLWWQGRRPRD
jgi:hypothetical protein